MSFAVTVYSTSWCSDCSRSKRLLQRAGIAFADIDIEKSDEAENAMRSLNGGSGKVPTILLQNETQRRILIEPSDAELKYALCEIEVVGNREQGTGNRTIPIPGDTGNTGGNLIKIRARVFVFFSYPFVCFVDQDCIVLFPVPCSLFPTACLFRMTRLHAT